MNARRIASVAVIGAAAALALAGCGSSDTATTAATAGTTATATTGTSTTAVTTLTCVGAEEACSVKVPLGGGASAERIAVELTGTDMGEPKVTVEPEYEGAYDISDSRFTTGGSVYEFTLDAVESIPEGVNLEMTFAQKP